MTILNQEHIHVASELMSGVKLHLTELFSGKFAIGMLRWNAIQEIMEELNGVENMMDTIPGTSTKTCQIIVGADAVSRMVEEFWR